MDAQIVKQDNGMMSKVPRNAKTVLLVNLASLQDNQHLTMDATTVPRENGMTFKAKAFVNIVQRDNMVTLRGKIPWTVDALRV
tara:strand:- start:194 stop:442 length:249 start_codon:yes stop_codon:yes gene_type:complete